MLYGIQKEPTAVALYEKCQSVVACGYMSAIHTWELHLMG